jgi:Xaa-Pro aminopeptidase
MSDVLIVGDSFRNPEIRHEVPVGIPDPFLYLEHDDRRVAVVGRFEVQRVEAAGAGLEVHAFERFGRDELQEQELGYDEILREVTVRVCSELGVRDAVVPPEFPVEIADRLRESGVEVRPDRPYFVARRRVKNEAELAGIRRAQRACEAAMDEARALLRRTERANGVLRLDGEPLTCERLKAAIERVFSDHGVSSDDPIVSHGPQTAVGHDTGSGPIAPDEPIVLDLYPRDRPTGCYSDMTRTFVVGNPPEELVEYARLVKEALDRSLAEIRAGASGRHVFDVACEVFERHGYPTLRTKDRGVVLEDGFFHSLGHGVGLEVHEHPALGKVGEDLLAGDVVTIEPGLYRRGFGGCRLEDLVLVTAEGAENLTQYPYDLTP